MLRIQHIGYLHYYKLQLDKMYKGLCKCILQVSFTVFFIEDRQLSKQRKSSHYKQALRWLQSITTAKFC